MTIELITSRHNPLAQQARAVRDGRERALVLLEGVRLCEEALHAALEIESVLHTQRLEEQARGKELLAKLSRLSKRLATVSESVLESVTDTKTSQGIVVLARRPQTSLTTFEARLAKEPLLVIMHGINNPSNAGAMLRVAEAAGACGVIATRGSTDLLSPKALRGSMGSALRLPLWTGAEFHDALAWCAAGGIKTISTALEATRNHTEVDWCGRRAVVVGSEASGLSQDELEAADVRVRIPMRPPVESLNVAIALAVILYEAARQRTEISGIRQFAENV